MLNEDLLNPKDKEIYKLKLQIEKFKEYDKNVRNIIVIF